MISPLALPYPFELHFMQRALVAGVAVGVFAPMIGTFLVQKRMSLIGDGIGHIAFAGVGAGLLGRHLARLWTALVFAVAGALGIEWLRSRRRASRRPRARAVLLLGHRAGRRAREPRRRLEREHPHVPVRPAAHGERHRGRADPGARARSSWSSMLALRRVLFAVVTDEDWSRVAGLPVGPSTSCSPCSPRCAVVAAMQIVGILLIAAMMVLPVATASCWRGRSPARCGGRWPSASRSVVAGLVAPRGSGTSRPAGRSCWWPPGVHGGGVGDAARRGPRPDDRALRPG